MSSPRFSTQSQKKLVDQLTQLVREQVQSSQQLNTSFRSREESTQTQFTTDADRLTENYQRDREQTETAQQQQIHEVRQSYDTESHHLAYLQAKLTERAQAKRHEAISENTVKWEHSCKQAQLIYEREKTPPEQKLAATQAQCDAWWHTLTAKRDELLEAMLRQGGDANEVPTAFGGELEGTPLDSYREAARRA